MVGEGRLYCNASGQFEGDLPMCKGRCFDNIGSWLIRTDMYLKVHAKIHATN